jgi:hypothetical protein
MVNPGLKYRAWRAASCRWKPREYWTPPRQLSDEERWQREQELTQQRRQELEAWTEERRRLGL